MLIAIYHTLKDGVHHKDPGAAYFNKRAAEFKVRRLVDQIPKLGFEATLQPFKKAA